MKIALIDNVCDPAKPARSGHSDIIWTLARHFANDGHSVYVIAPYTKVDFPIGKVNLIPVRKMRRINVITTSLLALQMMKIAKELDVDIIQATDAFSAGAGAFIHAEPIVFMVSGNVYQRIQAGNGLDKSAEVGYRIWSRLAAERSKAVICTSADMNYWWKKIGVSQDRLYNVPLGVDTKIFFPKIEERRSSDLSLLCIARLAEENNVELILDIVGKLKQMNFPFHLTVAGDGPLKNDLRSHSNDLMIDADITWLGQVKPDDLPQLYREGDIFLYSRLFGGPPRVILEAMASGLPIASFSASGVDTYVQNGWNGLLFPPGNNDEFAAGIVQLGTDASIRQQMGHNSRSQAITCYDWEVVVRQYRQIYDEVLCLL